MFRFSLYKFDKFGRNLSVTGIVAASQVITGFGLGLLVAEKVRRSTRVLTAVSLISFGIAALIPTIVGIIERVANRPTSPRLMRRRLESIRGDSGLAETESI